MVGIDDIYSSGASAGGEGVETECERRICIMVEMVIVIPEGVDVLGESRERCPFLVNSGGFGRYVPEHR